MDNNQPIGDEKIGIREAVVAKLRKLVKDGKDIFGGYFCGYMGDPMLTVSHHSADEVSIMYSCGNKMWQWIEKKSKIFNHDQ